MKCASLPSHAERSSTATLQSRRVLLCVSLKQLYIGQPYVPRNIYVPVDFEDREALEELLSEQLAEKAGAPPESISSCRQRGDKRSLIDLAGNNAKQSYDQRFRVMKPNAQRHSGSVAGRARRCPSCRSASSASTSRTFKARRPSRRWWCGKTAR